MALNLVKEQLDHGVDPLAILASCREGMAAVGRRCEAGEYFVSELIMAGELLKEASRLLNPHIKTDGDRGRGKVVIGTVKGDIHDIGKDIVVNLLNATGYEVIDLGVDVPVDRFVEAVRVSGTAVVGLSCLLTVSFDAMRATVDELKNAGLRSKVKVMIGGGPIAEQVRQHVGADAFGADAQAAVSCCNRWMQEATT
ncbi:MAG: cobalamin-dependent protein [Chloroflexi bacterium]|nr:cobalamin-dependent protein [Chloroflexota bacterium]